VQNDTFQEQNAFLEFEKLFPFGIQHSSWQQWQWWWCWWRTATATSTGCFLLWYPSHLHAVHL
jgi:hypothetical protein